VQREGQKCEKRCGYKGVQGTHESTVSTIFIFSRNVMNAFTVI